MRRIPPAVCELLGLLFTITLFALIVVALCGCAGFPQNQRAESTIEQTQREQVTGTATTDLVNRSITTPTPTKIEVPGAEGQPPTTIEIPPTMHTNIEGHATASESSDSAASGSASSMWSLSVPFWLALGAGLLMFAVACWLLFLLIRKSLAVRTAFRVGDEFMSSGINTIKTMAMHETDQKTAGMLAAVVSALEGKRADFNTD